MGWVEQYNQNTCFYPNLTQKSIAKFVCQMVEFFWQNGGRVSSGPGNSEQGKFSHKASGDTQVKPLLNAQNDGMFGDGMFSDGMFSDWDI